MSLPLCEWCGEYTAVIGEKRCLLCQSTEPESREAAPRTAVWRRSAPDRPWLVYGHHATLVRAMEAGTTVAVRRTDGEISHQQLDYVSEPDTDNFAWGHPAGRRLVGEPVVTHIPPARRRSRSQMRRRHPNGRNAARKGSMR